MWLHVTLGIWNKQDICLHLIANRPMGNINSARLLGVTTLRLNLIYLDRSTLHNKSNKSIWSRSELSFRNRPTLSCCGLRWRSDARTGDSRKPRAERPPPLDEPATLATGVEWPDKGEAVKVHAEKLLQGNTDLVLVLQALILLWWVFLAILTTAHGGRGMWISFPRKPQHSYANWQ